MALSIASAGLAWGVPVRPDLLGRSLEAYDKCLPVLTALRLCYRFGKGSNAGITKLPVEIVVAIEHLILVDGKVRVCGSSMAAPWTDSS